MSVIKWEKRLISCLHPHMKAKNMIHIFRKTFLHYFGLEEGIKRNSTGLIPIASKSVKNARNVQFYHVDHAKSSTTLKTILGCSGAFLLQYLIDTSIFRTSDIIPVTLSLWITVMHWLCSMTVEGGRGG
jgi:hypothetical protein